jgi:hypothetical protein
VDKWHIDMARDQNDNYKNKKINNKGGVRAIKIWINDSNSALKSETIKTKESFNSLYIDFN